MAYKPPGSSGLGAWYTWPVSLRWHEWYHNEQERGNDLQMPVGIPVYAWDPGWVLTRSNNDHAVGDQPPPASQPNPNNAFAETGYNSWGGEVDWYDPKLQPEVKYVMHLDQLAVKPGDYVQTGQLIGWSGGENTLAEGNVVEGYKPTNVASKASSSGPHIEIGLYDPHNYDSTTNPAAIIDFLRQRRTPPLPAGSCGDVPSPFDPLAYAQWVQCVLGQIGGSIPLGNPFDPSTWVAAIQSGFKAPLQRIGLIVFGGLLVLAGILILLLPHVEQAAQQAAPLAMAAA